MSFLNGPQYKVKVCVGELIKRILGVFSLVILVSFLNGPQYKVKVCVGELIKRILKIKISKLHSTCTEI